MTAHRWSDVERIFHAALELPAEARPAFLTESCADDEALRREVESLLDETSQTGFLEQPALHVAAGMAQNSNAVQLTGQRIGVYQIQALLGKGGMGEVYRARDTRLDREVAIKVLPRAFTADPDRLARFEREARVLASLNHPHIGMIHGLEEGGGMRALVLELVEGDTLANRIARGPVPIKQALTWARQIADALDAAHEKGIVHRDLKPANVKITPNDVVKVLDFGLARTYTSGDEAGDLTRSPTITSDGGAILGTAAYMSPEQARGQAVGKRADIWAFGCVLYEMLTGHIAFDGPSVSDTLAAVLHHEPDWTALPSRLPTSVTTLLQRCLEKDVKQRRRDIGDVRAELDDALARPSGVTRSDVSAPVAARRAPWPWWVLAVAGGIVLAALAGVLADRRFNAAPAAAPGPATEARSLHITSLIGMEEMPAVSPNGNEVAYVFPVNGRRQIWRQLLAGGEPRRITDDDVDHTHPRWTPDSNAIVYFTASAKESESGTLHEILALGGTVARKVALATTGADVSHEGSRIAAFQKAPDGVSLAILERSSGVVRQAFKLPTVIGYETPRWSPDDRSIAYVANHGNGRYVLYIVDLAVGTPRELTRAFDMNGITWLPDGTGLVYASSSGSTIRYPPVFNLRTVSRDGAVQGQLTVGDVSHVHPDMVQAGKLFASRVRMQSDIWRFPVSGSPANFKTGTRITHQTAQVQTPSASPDGRELAYLSDSGGHSNLWVTRIDGSSSPRQLTFERNPDQMVGIPIWSPAGNRIVFIQTEISLTKNILYVINPADGSDLRQVVEGGTGATWSPDGRSLYYQIYSPSESCIYKIHVDGGDPARVRCGASMSMVSSNEKTLYFSPGSPGRANEIFKASPPDGEPVPVRRYAPSQMPTYPTGHVLSADDRWIAAPLKDGVTTNIWAIPTDGGPMRQLTDFGQQGILIARQVSWSKDGKFVYAAVVETDADIVLLDGILPRPGPPPAR